MASAQVLFDARYAPLPLDLTFLMMVSGAGLFGIFALWHARREVGEKALMRRAGGALFLLIVAAALGSQTFCLLLRSQARAAIASGRVSTLGGCVQNLQRNVSRNDRTLDTYFALDGRSFHFNNTVWIPGFHNQDNTIVPGEGLRITMHGKTALRIERAPLGCQAAKS